MTLPQAPSSAATTLLSLPSGPASICDEGAGPPILALHGAPGSVRDFRWLAPCVAGPARLIRLNRPGFGGAPVEAGPGLTADDYATFALQVMDALGLQRALVCGHSLGGVAAMRLAASRPDRIPGCALLSSPGLRPHRSWRQLNPRALEAILARPWTQRMFMPALRRGFVSAGFSRRTPDPELVRTVRAAAALDFGGLQSDVEALRPRGASVLMAWCHDDPLIEREIFEGLDRALPGGPRLTFPDGGHNPQKTHAVEIGAALAQWATALMGGAL